MIRVRKDWNAGITSIDQADIQITYWITGTRDEFEARIALVTEADPVFDGREPTAYVLRKVTPSKWEAIVTYSAVEWERNFEIGTETVTITQALQNVGNYAAVGNTAPNFNGAIGVTRESIEGVAIPIPIRTWSETHYFDPKLIDAAYEDAAEFLTGKTNDRAWRTHQAGEVMFEGVAGGISRGKTRMPLTFKFRKSRNRGAFNVGNITVPQKKGFDYLWVNYVEYPDPASFRMVKVPYSAHVDRVIESGSFDVLRLPR